MEKIDNIIDLVNCDKFKTQYNNCPAYYIYICPTDFKFCWHSNPLIYPVSIKITQRLYIEIAKFCNDSDVHIDLPKVSRETLSKFYYEEVAKHRKIKFSKI